jgi:hypothetical protein
MGDPVEEIVAPAAIERALMVYQQLKPCDQSVLLQARKILTQHIYGLVDKGECDEQRLIVGGLSRLKALNAITPSARLNRFHEREDVGAGPGLNPTNADPIRPRRPDVVSSLADEDSLGYCSSKLHSTPTKSFRASRSKHLWPLKHSRRSFAEIVRLRCHTAFA